MAEARTETKYLIWWLRHSDIELLTFERNGISYANMPRNAPGWLRDQVLACHGRPGRGRLWIHPDFTDCPHEASEVSTWTTPLRLSTNNCYGIVITPNELAHLRDLPGIVTNFNYQRLPQAEPPPL